MKQLKYKQYWCSYGNIIIYEDGSVAFVPFLSVNINETLAMSELDDLDFDNDETCEFLTEDVAEFEEKTSDEDNALKEIWNIPEDDDCENS